MIYASLKTIHLFSIVVWIGGMAFAHFFLRPAVAQLEAPVRLRLMHDVLGRFFQAVLVSLIAKCVKVVFYKDDPISKQDGLGNADISRYSKQNVQWKRNA